MATWSSPWADVIGYIGPAIGLVMLIEVVVSWARWALSDEVNDS